MKPFTALLLVLIAASCQHNDGKATYTAGTTSKVNGYIIASDTITINDEENILPLLRYNGNYYYSAYAKDSLGDYEFIHFGDVNSDGDVKKIVGKIDKGRLGDDDIHILHDSVVIQPSFYYDESLYLDERNKQLLPIKKIDDVVFEDGDYYVTSLDFGEWGSATWFKDKKTGLEYEAARFLNPEVIKFKGAYYLISPSEINVVDNPKLLVNTGKGTYRKFKTVDKVGGFYSRKPKGHDKGLKNIYSREMTYDIEREFFIGPAFIHNDSLRFIVNENNTLYVAKAEDKKLIYIAKIRDSIYSQKQQNNYRNRYLTKTIRFTTMKEELGLLEVKDNNIMLHYFKFTPKISKP